MKIKILLLAAVFILTMSLFASACGGSKETPTSTPALTSSPTQTPTTAPTLTPKPSPEKNLVLGGVPSTSSVHEFFNTLGQVLNAGIPDIQFDVKDTLGSQAVMNGIIGNTTVKDYNFGQSLASVEYMAYTGIAPWTTANTDVRRLCSWSTQDLLIAVTETSGIQSMADLSGNVLRVGIAGSLTEVTTGQIMGTLGIQPSYDKTSLTNLAGDLKGNKISGFVEFLPHNVSDATIDQIQQETPLRLLNFTAEDIQKVKAVYPYMTTGEIEAGVYKNENKITTFNIVATLATLKDSLTMDEAYRIVKTIWEGKDTLAAGYSSFANYNLPKESVDTSIIPLHAGAYKYFKELGITIPDILIPPEATQ